MIFVNVAAYRDPETKPTIEDLFAKARNPGAIRVVVVLQSEASDGLWFERENVRIVQVKASESKGCGWARSLGYQYLTDEDTFVLQIDSHTRFAQDWDAKLLKQIRLCRSPKSILGVYPPHFWPPNQLTGSLSKPLYMRATHFDQNGMVNFTGANIVTVPPHPPGPRLSAAFAGCFAFGPAAWVRDVRYDPFIVFHGEEPTMGARLWTSGWDLFSPSQPILWHCWGRLGRRCYWDDHDLAWGLGNARSLRRMHHLLAGERAEPEALIDIGKYGLGSVRSLSAYQEFAGIDFKARHLAEHAILGQWG